MRGWPKGEKRGPMSEKQKQRIGKAMTGLIHSEKSKSKISKALVEYWKSEGGVERRKNHRLGCEGAWEERRKGVLASWTNPEVRKRHIQAARESALWGSANPAWNGGISFEPYPPGFNAALKRKIRERDHHTCQLCGMAEEESKEKWNQVLNVNHIDYDKQNIEETNLITLCKSCNIQVNFNRGCWQEFFSVMIKEGNNEHRGL